MRPSYLLGCSTAAVALASASPATAQQRAFDIPAQPLHAAIAALSRQAGVQIVAPAEGLDQRRSAPLSGTMDARAALRRLITGSGLEIASDEGSRIVLRRLGADAGNDAATLADTGESADADIVVTGYRASLQTARETKRQSSAILDTVAAEDIGQLPDNSATEALARLPGVQVFRNRGEGQAITVRGLSQVLTTLNGQESYVGASRRSLLNTYPADLLRAVTVYKALTPDLIEGGIGGAIDIQLRQPFDFQRGWTVAGTARGSYDDQARRFFYNGDLLVSNHWQTGVGEIGVLLNASYVRRDYLESYRENFGPQTSTATQSITPAGLGAVRYPTRSLVKHPNGNFKRPVLTGELQWKPVDDLRLDMRVTHIHDKNTYFDNDLELVIPAGTALRDVTLVPGTDIVKSARYTLATPTGPRSSYNLNDIRTTQGEFGVRYDAGRATLSTNLTYTRSKQEQIVRAVQLAFRSPQTIDAVFHGDSRWGSLSYQLDGSTDLEDPATFKANLYSDALVRQKSRGLQWRGDLVLDTEGGLISALKSGFRYTDRSTDYQSGSRSVSFSALNLPLSALPGGASAETIDRGFRGDDVTVPSRWVEYPAALLGTDAGYAALNAYVANLPGQATAFASERPAFSPTASFGGTERTYAVYGQVQYGFTLAGIAFDGVAGARAVNTVLSIRGTQLRTTGTGAGRVTTAVAFDQRQNYLDVDPSVSLVAHLSPVIQLRGAWTKTFSRPDFTQLNPSVSVVESAGGASATAVASGNPALRPIRSENLDVSLEGYFGRAGAASVALFHRDVDGFIINTIDRVTLPGSTTPTSVTRPFNGGAGTIKGVELSVSSFLDVAPGLLRNLGASANFTYIDTEQVLPQTGANVASRGLIPGISKRSFNSSLFYDDGRFRARVAYSVRSRFILSYVLADPTANLNWFPISRLDASTAYKLTDAITLTLDAQNLLGRPQRAFWGPGSLAFTGYTDRVYYEGRVYSLAARFQF